MKRIFLTKKTVDNKIVNEKSELLRYDYVHEHIVVITTDVS